MQTWPRKEGRYCLDMKSFINVALTWFNRIQFGYQFPLFPMCFGGKIRRPRIWQSGQISEPISEPTASLTHGSSNMINARQGPRLAILRILWFSCCIPWHDHPYGLGSMDCGNRKLFESFSSDSMMSGPLCLCFGRSIGWHSSVTRYLIFLSAVSTSFWIREIDQHTNWTEFAETNYGFIDYSARRWKHRLRLEEI